MKIIILIILIFMLGFCFGALFELKNTKKVIKFAEKQNDEWSSLCSKHDQEWYEYCETLIEQIKTLKEMVGDENG